MNNREKARDGVELTNIEKSVEKFLAENQALQKLAKERRDKLLEDGVKDDKVTDEISTTSGYEFNNQNRILATSGKKKYEFDITQNSFAWIKSNKVEKKMIKTMKKGSRIMVTGYNKSGSQTIDHYSLLGFTKAYNTAKKSCT